MRALGGAVVPGRRFGIGGAPEFSGPAWSHAVRLVVVLVRDVGFPIAVALALWFDLRPQIIELVHVTHEILEIQAGLAARKCIPLGQEWQPVPNAAPGPGKHGCPLYERVEVAPISCSSCSSWVVLVSG